jgi:hypothetical protein
LLSFKICRSIVQSVEVDVSFPLMLRFGIRENLTITYCLSEQGEEMAAQNNQKDTLNITVEFT